MVVVSVMIRPSTPRRNAGLTLAVLARLREHYGSLLRVRTFGCSREALEAMCAAAAAATAADPTIDPTCSDWKCSCQGISDRYETKHSQSSFGKATQPAIDWWMAHDCVTDPSAASSNMTASMGGAPIGNAVERGGEETCRVLSSRSTGVEEASGSRNSSDSNGGEGGEGGEGGDATLRSAVLELHHAGVVGRVGVAEVLRGSDLFLDLSRWQAFGFTALEAMASGAVPVISKRGGAEAFAIDGVNAVVVDISQEDAAAADADDIGGTGDPLDTRDTRDGMNGPGHSKAPAHDESHDAVVARRIIAALEGIVGRGRAGETGEAVTGETLRGMQRMAVETARAFNIDRVGETWWEALHTVMAR